MNMLLEKAYDSLQDLFSHGMFTNSVIMGFVIFTPSVDFQNRFLAKEPNLSFL